MDENTLKEIAENGVKISHLEGRVKKIENTVDEIRQLTTSVQILANNMASMLDEQRTQNDRLDKLESVPTDRWNTLVKTVLTALVGAIVGYFLTRLGL